MSNQQNQQFNQRHINCFNEESNNYLQHNQSGDYTYQNNSLQNFSMSNQLFPGYVRNDDRIIPAGFYSTSFQTAYSNFENELTIKKMSDEIKRLKKNQIQTLTNLQEQQPESQIRISVCSDSNEDDYGDYDAPLVV